MTGSKRRRINAKQKVDIDGDPHCQLGDATAHPGQTENNDVLNDYVVVDGTPATAVFVPPIRDFASSVFRRFADRLKMKKRKSPEETATDEQ